jgi:hypothetical protein
MSITQSLQSIRSYIQTEGQEKGAELGVQTI